MPVRPEHCTRRYDLDLRECFVHPRGYLLCETGTLTGTGVRNDVVRACCLRAFHRTFTRSAATRGRRRRRRRPRRKPNRQTGGRQPRLRRLLQSCQRERTRPPPLDGIADPLGRTYTVVHTLRRSIGRYTNAVTTTYRSAKTPSAPVGRFRPGQVWSGSKECNVVVTHLMAPIHSTHAITAWVHHALGRTSAGWSSSGSVASLFILDYASSPPPSYHPSNSIEMSFAFAYHI